MRIYLPPPLFQQLEEYSKAQGKSKAAIVRGLLVQAGIIEKDTVAPYQDRGGYFSKAATLERQIKKQLEKAPRT